VAGPGSRSRLNAAMIALPAPEPANMAKVRAAYEAFTSGDIDEFVALLAHDFVSQQSAAVPWRGSYRGLRE